MATVKILGSGCSKCKVLEQRLLSLKATHNLTFDLVKVTASMTSSPTES